MSQLIVICSLLLCSIEAKASFVNAAHSANNEAELESINGTRNFRLYGKKGIDDKPWFNDRDRVMDMRHIHCVRPARCEEVIENTTCLGSKIPYTLTSLDLTDYNKQEHALERLNNYQALRHVPKCWAVVQPFLCAVFVPKCEKIKGKEMVYLPSLEMCKLTLEPCRILYNTSYFPEFLKCNETLFPSKCNNDVREMKFNVTGECLPPLVAADSSASYYSGIEGCGVQCKDPLYTDDEHRQIHKMILWMGTACLICNVFVIATFLIDCDKANKYPSVIVFYINICFMLICLGCLAQFTPGGREDIVCRKDGTLRHSEPSAGENLSCIVVFVLIYYFSISSMVWLVFFTYAWHLRAVGNVQDRIDKKGSYFHLVSWSLPLVLTITAMATSEVDANSTVGICFVGYLNHSMRSGLLLGPLCGVILIGGYFIIRGMIKLSGFEHFNKKIKSRDSNKIHKIIVHMSSRVLVISVFILVTIICHITEFRSSDSWTDSLQKYIVCRISSQHTDEQKDCKLENRPSFAILQLNLLCLFGTGITMSTWCFSRASLKIWKRYIRTKCGKDASEDTKMPKHKIIAQTWARRKEFEDEGRLSIKLYNSHTDPVGLNFDVNDLNSSATNEISSTWANYLPQFVKRRFALTGQTATNSSSYGAGGGGGGGPRKSSLDSEISFRVRHVSVESRRNSADSQVSVKISEVETKVPIRSRASAKSRKGRRNVLSTTGRRCYNRRESSTSIESQVIALNKTAYPNNVQKVGLFSHSKTGKSMKRRSASGALNPDDIKQFLSKNGQFIIPFLQNQGMTTTSDEEVSGASFKMQDSRLDVVLKQDVSDDYRDAARIEEYVVSDEDENNAQDLLKQLQTSSSFENILDKDRNRHSKLEEILKNIRTSSSFDNMGLDSNSRNSRNSNKGRNSRKSVANRSSSRNHKNTSVKIAKRDADINVGQSVTSYSSELELPNILMHSSYSGVSNGKPHSRNSKTSCDVGTQADAHEINQTLSSYEDEVKKAIRQFNSKNHKNIEYDANSDSEGEVHQLLPPKTREAIIMSESERLKMLLLPSK